MGCGYGQFKIFVPLNVEINMLINVIANKMIKKSYLDSMRYKYQNLLKKLIQCSIKIHKYLDLE